MRRTLGELWDAFTHNGPAYHPRWAADIRRKDEWVLKAHAEKARAERAEAIVTAVEETLETLRGPAKPADKCVALGAGFAGAAIRQAIRNAREEGT